MNIQRIPLDRQLTQLRHGNPAHPEYNACAIRHMSATPIILYLRDCAAECVYLMSLLGIPRDQEDRLTYQEAAVYIDKLWEQPETKHLASESIEILALPLMDCYEKRKNAYGNSAENPT